MSTIGQNIKRLRTQRKLTQEQLAKKSGIARSAIARLEIGLRKAPTIATVKKLCRALRVPITDLI